MKPATSASFTWLRLHSLMSQKIVVWMKRAETLCGVIRVLNAVLLEFGKVGEEVIDVSVLWRRGLGRVGELIIHGKSQGQSITEVGRGRTGGKWGRCKIDLWEVLMEANDRVACPRSKKVQDSRWWGVTYDHK
jgi:hypothetical protein